MKSRSIKALILAGIIAVALGAAGVRMIDDYIDRMAWGRVADVVYPMANQHIEWTGAGYR